MCQLVEITDGKASRRANSRIRSAMTPEKPGTAALHGKHRSGIALLLLAKRAGAPAAPGQSRLYPIPRRRILDFEFRPAIRGASKEGGLAGFKSQGRVEARLGPLARWSRSG